MKLQEDYKLLFLIEYHSSSGKKYQFMFNTQEEEGILEAQSHRGWWFGIVEENSASCRLYRLWGSPDYVEDNLYDIKYFVEEEEVVELAEMLANRGGRAAIASSSNDAEEKNLLYISDIVGMDITLTKVSAELKVVSSDYIREEPSLEIKVGQKGTIAPVAPKVSLTLDNILTLYIPEYMSRTTPYTDTEVQVLNRYKSEDRSLDENLRDVKEQMINWRDSVFKYPMKTYYYKGREAQPIYFCVKKYGSRLVINLEEEVDADDECEIEIF